MIQEKITQEEIDFMLAWHYPPCLAESLFSNFDNLTECKDNFGSLRPYQYPMLSFESTIDTSDKTLTPREKFDLRKGVGEIYNFGARRYGKSLITEKIDICLSMVNDDNMWSGFASADQIHLQDILDVVTRAVSYHPILRMWKQRMRASPKYEITARNGWLLHSVNMNIAAKDSGSQFFGKHFQKLWIEEASMENDKAYDKRKDAVSELGAIIRSSGMTNFTKFTPAGRAFYDSENKSKILNLPQFVNPLFDDKEDKIRQKEYGGRDSVAYRVFVSGEVCEDGLSEFDIQRIQPYINERTPLKVFEVKKEAFGYFQNIIVVERPTNAERIFIAADIGDGAGGSEIIILSEIGNKYNYLYRISLYNLKDDEQYEIFDWLIQKLQANVVSLDCGDGTGRAIMRRIEKKYPKDGLVRYAGMEKIGVDFKKDEKGAVIIEDGKPALLEEFMSEWSVRFLKVLLYEGRVNIPQDYKFIKQLNSMISRVVGSRTVYACVSEDGDHVIDAWKVFSTAVWLKKDFNSTPVLSTPRGVGACNWATKRKVNKELEEFIKNKEKIECTAEEYKAVHQHLVNASMKANVTNNKELLGYLSNEIIRLNEIFKKG